MYKLGTAIRVCRLGQLDCILGKYIDMNKDTPNEVKDSSLIADLKKSAIL